MPVRSPLTRAIRNRRTSQKWIELSVNKKIGPTASLLKFRELGGQIRTQTWFRDYNEYLKKPVKRKTFQFVGLTKRYTTASMTKWGGFQKTRFRYRLSIVQRVKRTGQLVNFLTDIASDERLTRQQVFEKARFIATKLQIETDMVLDKLTLETIYWDGSPEPL